MTFLKKPFESAVACAEDRLLVLAAAFDCEGAGEDLLMQARALVGETGDKFDWTYLIEKARIHAIRPLLYDLLRLACPEIVPSDVMEGLAMHFQANARRNLFLTGELFKILNLFEENSILAVPYKGPVLAHLAYGNMALREFGDLDLLVKEQDVCRASELLRTIGYSTDEREFGAFATAAHRKYHTEDTFISKDGRVELDLHWSVTRAEFSFPFGTDALWERLVDVPFAGQTVKSFCPEDMLCVLSAHNGKHGWERLSWIADIKGLLKTFPDMNFQSVFERMGGEERSAAAGKQGLEAGVQPTAASRTVLSGLSLASELLNARVSANVKEMIKADPVVGELAGMVVQRFFRDAAVGREKDAAGDIVDNWLFQLKMKRTLAGKLGYCVRLATSPHKEDFSSVRLPESLFPLYRAVRPVRLFGKYGRAVLRRLV